MHIHKKLVSLITLSLVLLNTTACSQRIGALNDTLKLAFIGDKDVKLSTQQVNDIPYASIYAQIGDMSQVFIVLVFAEPKVSLTQVPTTLSTELKWLSADKGMIVTVNGRLVRTHNNPTGDLVAVESTEPDPIMLGLQLASTPKTWTRIIDWQPGYHFGYRATSYFNLVGQEKILINDIPTQALHYSEIVLVDDLNIQYQNEFWLTPETGNVIKSRQKIAPNLPFIDISLLKPFAS
ncbi:YjbF family lipoprotein [Shewanella baltica]|uniref:YjbF family lipoprotein n=1 Tax=Shewanella baltica TaxID=62322 RepID=UPI00014F8E76|nr:YjbF family lipoprotein [Shewanella baltica]ABS09012.1 lipoprotein, putative [Shewanella baltica OS185]ACK46003.1 lipoprotein, putative [Shewanella baltica OS223]MCS6117131.1 YjbF family lipoprotein [Shewanella baltica]MCS6206958.1 YjbF family lipoprotein [Shewanella baltica]MCS6209194.1 YjbF family lipoprotein [Shewanella baltica]